LSDLRLLCYGKVKFYAFNTHNHSSAVLWPASERVERVGTMKDAIDSIPAARPIEPEGFANRKLIRPSLNHTEHHHPQPAMGERRDRPERPDRSERNDRAGGVGRKSAPPEQTNAENFYYQKQMQSKTPMVIVLRDGEEIRGTIEWYDKTCLKLNRSGQPNLMIYKPSIKYMYKEGENSRR
jgi:host factor-I protein